MRQVEKTILYFKEGKSDKVYEVELCEAGEGEFVVNFKYGRRGSTLREGTKTVFPESEEKAWAIFDGLVTEKTKKGYRPSLEEFEAANDAVPKETIPAAGPEVHPMVAAVLGHLAKAARDEDTNWSLARVLWRVGELQSRDAVADLLKLEQYLDSSMVRYNFAWALGRCAGEDALAAQLLKRVYEEAGRQGEFWVQRMAAEAYCRTADGSARSLFIAERLRELPEWLNRDLGRVDVNELYNRIIQQQQRGEPLDWLPTLYLATYRHPEIGDLLLRFCDQVAFVPGNWKPVRHLFKSVEFRGDERLYAKLVYRFETTKEFFSDSGYGYTWFDGRSYRIHDELKKPNPALAYSNRTRRVFRGHAIRVLRNLGRSGQNADYARMATEILLGFDDAVDRRKPSEKISYEYERIGLGGRSHLIRIHFDDYAQALILNDILYANSPRYEPVRGGKVWRCKADYKPGDPARADREEAFPDAWDDEPNLLLKLLRESRCFRVHEFAGRVFRANESFAGHVTIDDLVNLFGTSFTITQELALEIARQKYDAANPSLELVTAMLRSDLAAARQLAAQWIAANSTFFFADINLLVDLICAPHVEIMEALGETLKAQTFPADKQSALVNLVVARMLRLESEGDEAEALAGRVAEMLLLIGADGLKGLERGSLLPLIDHGLPANQAFAAEVMQLFDESKLESCGAVVMRLCLSEHPRVRSAARPALGRLARKSRSFGEDAFRQCYPLLLRKERYAGLHADVLQLIENELSGFLDEVPTEYISRMLASRYLPGKQLGWRLHGERIGLANESMRRIAHLGNNALLEIRVAVHEYLRSHVYDVKRDLEDALRLLDSEWDDSREFGLSFFADSIGETDWTPALLVSLCDKSHPRVQSFGRELITRYFKNEDGNEYLLKLSQHPTTELQTFATNYLERYAAGQPERIAELENYLITVLSRVNRGRTAKARVQKFLADEAAKSVDSAMTIARILKRQVVTIAKGDKSACIQLLLRIKRQYPDIDNPLTIKSPPRLEATEA